MGSNNVYQRYLSFPALIWIRKRSSGAIGCCLVTRGIAVKDRLVIGEREKRACVLLVRSAVHRLLVVLSWPISLSPATVVLHSYLWGAILISLLVPEHGLHGRWIRKWNCLRCVPATRIVKKVFVLAILSGRVAALSAICPTLVCFYFPPRDVGW